MGAIKNLEEIVKAKLDIYHEELDTIVQSGEPSPLFRNLISIKRTIDMLAELEEIYRFMASQAALNSDEPYEGDGVRVSYYPSTAYDYSKNPEWTSLQLAIDADKQKQRDIERDMRFRQEAIATVTDSIRLTKLK